MANERPTYDDLNSLQYTGNFMEDNKIEIISPEGNAVFAYRIKRDSPLRNRVEFILSGFVAKLNTDVYAKNNIENTIKTLKAELAAAIKK